MNSGRFWGFLHKYNLIVGSFYYTIVLLLLLKPPITRALKMNIFPDWISIALAVVFGVVGIFLWNKARKSTTRTFTIDELNAYAKKEEERKRKKRQAFIDGAMGRGVEKQKALTSREIEYLYQLYKYTEGNIDVSANYEDIGVLAYQNKYSGLWQGFTHLSQVKDIVLSLEYKGFIKLIAKSIWITKEGVTRIEKEKFGQTEEV